MIVLGIETTCDETAAAVVERSEDGRGKILSNIVLSQVERACGLRRRGAGNRRARPCRGARPRHRQGHDARPGCGFDAIDGVAAAAGPGLIGGVIVGLTTAKAIALVHEQAADRGQSSGSARADRAADRRTRRFPIACSSPPAATPRSSPCAASAITCGSAPRSTTPSARPSTRPPSCSASAIRAGRRSRRKRRAAMPTRFALPRPMHGRKDADFSLSGLKTALRLEAEKIAPLVDQDVADLCASFQQAVVDVVLDRLRAGLRMFRARYGAPTALVAAGGVAANQAIRKVLHRAGRSRSAPCWWRRRSSCAPTTAP